MKNNYSAAIFLSISLSMFSWACVAKNSVKLDRTTAEKNSKMTNNSTKISDKHELLKRVSQRLDVLPAGNRSDVKQVRKDILFQLTKCGSTPMEVLPYLSRGALYNTEESTFIPWCFKNIVTEKDDIVLMINLLPLLSENKSYSFYQNPATKEKLFELAQRISKANCQEYWQKYMKFRILDRVYRIFYDRNDSIEKLELTDMAISAARQCPGLSEKDYKFIVNSRKGLKAYLKRQSTNPSSYPGQIKTDEPISENLELAHKYYKSKKYKETIAKLTEVKEERFSTYPYNKPDFPEQQTLLALCYYNLNQKTKAEEALRENEKIYHPLHGYSRRGSHPYNSNYYAKLAPKSYCRYLINRGDIAALLNDKLRANRFYHAAQLMFDQSNLKDPDLLKDLGKKISDTKNYDTSEEYWQKKFKTIIRQLRCIEDVRDDYKERVKFLEHIKKNDSNIEELKTKVHESDDSKDSHPRQYFSNLIRLADKYRYRFEDQLSIDPEYITESNRLRLQAINFFIESPSKNIDWSRSDIEDLFETLRSVEITIPEKLFEDYFRKTVKISDALKLKDDDEYSEYLSNLINGKPSEDYQDYYEIDYPDGRSFEQRKHLYNIWLDIRKTNRGSNSPDITSVLIPLRNITERAGKYEEAKKLTLESYEVENNTLADKVRNKLSYAQFLLRNKKVNESVKQWKEAGKICNWKFPDNSGYSFKYLCRGYSRRNLDKEAKKLIETVVAHNPDTLKSIFDPMFMYEVNSCLTRSNFKKALALVEQRIEIAKQVPNSTNDEYWQSKKIELSKIVNKSER